MAESKRTCFGFFTGDDSCQRCAAAKKCKAVLVSNGFDIAAGILEELLATLPEGDYTLNLDEIHADLTPGAGDVLKTKAREEAGAVYGQLVYGPADPAAAEENKVSADAVDPDAL